MPQIVTIVAPGAEEKLPKGALDDFEKKVVELTEMIFGIKGENDVAITRLNATKTVNEADLQFEVRYTTGEDEYDRGEIFDPTVGQRKELSDMIISTARIVLLAGDNVEVSAWVKPIYGSRFKTTLQ